jgi:hypothetical protein
LRIPDRSRKCRRQSRQIERAALRAPDLHAAPGKLDALNARFRDHTNKLFVSTASSSWGYWTPTDGEAAKNTLIYILAFPDKDSREKSWKAFQADPDWQKAKAESEKDGPLLAKAPDSVMLQPTDYSPIR